MHYPKMYIKISIFAKRTENREKHAKEHKRLALDSDTLFCVGPAIPCHNIHFGHNVQRHGHQQYRHCAIHEFSSHPMDYKAAMEPVC